RGATSHWANSDLLGMMVGGLAALVIIWAWSPAGTSPAAAIPLTLVLLGVALGGFLFPVRQYLDRAAAARSLSATMKPQVIRNMLFGASLAGVALLGTWGSIQWAPRWAFQLEPDPA